jgi:hypothetical protein
MKVPRVGPNSPMTAAMRADARWAPLPGFCPFCRLRAIADALPVPAWATAYRQT